MNTFLLSKDPGSTMTVDYQKPVIRKAYRHCIKIARNHYENFPVASLLVPRQYRPAIAAIYAFARTGDDFADVENDLDKLENWRYQLHTCTEKQAEHPIFVALADAIQQFDLPVQLLDDLLTAFRWDLEKNRYVNFDELFHYSRFSANPVGRLLLHIFGYRDEEIFEHSDKITTALQLSNFWQDISVDLNQNRIYIPLDTLDRFGIDENQILHREYNTKFGALMEHLIGETESLFFAGQPILNYLSGRLRWEIRLTIAGGRAMLSKIRKNQREILIHRPELTKIDWLKIVYKTKKI